MATTEEKSKSRFTFGELASIHNHGKGMGFTTDFVDAIGAVMGMSIMYFLGSQGYSLAWILILCGVTYLREKLWRRRQKRLLSLRQTALREKEIVSTTLGELPAWVQFPEMEKVEWINKVIKQAWPYIGIYSQDFIRKVIEPQVKAAMPGPFKSFAFELIDIGDIPLRVGGIHVHKHPEQQGQIIMDMDVMYSGDCNIVVKVGAFKGGIRAVKFYGRLRCILKPLIPKPPMIGGVTAFFLDDPGIEFDLTGLGEMGELPGLAGVIKNITTEQVRNICVLPNVIVVPLSEETETTELFFPEPDGVLRIHVVEAADLENRDVIGKSDPYCKFSVGSQIFETKVVEDNLNPVWSELFECVVDQASGQRVELELFDHDKAGSDEELGRLSVDISSVREKGMIDSWYPLDAAKHGKVHLVMYWMKLTPEPGDMFETLKGGQWLKKWEEAAKVDAGGVLHPCVLMVYIDKAKDLPSLSKRGHDPIPQISVRLGEKTEKTLPKEATRDPEFRRKFLFFVRDPQTEVLHVEALDTGYSDKKNSLGQAAVPVVSLLREHKMEIHQKEWNLVAQGLPTSTVTMTLRLRSLKGVAMQDMDVQPRSP